jgi:ketosteroid isomerase-like protein
VVAAATLTALLACEPGPPAQGVATDTVRLLVARYDSAWASKDSVAVARLLAPAYTYFTSTGRLSRRDDALGFLADTSYVLTCARRSELQIAVAGPVARVASRWEGTGRFQGSPVRDDQTCGQIWVRDGARWQLFSEHCVNRPAPDPAPPAS